MFLGHKLRAGGAYYGPTVTTFTDSGIDTANTNSYTFSALSIGTADADRMVVVTGQYAQGSQTGITVTIGGVSATVILDAAGGAQVPFVAYLKVATGTTADVVVTRVYTGNSPQFCAVQVYSVITTKSEPDEIGFVVPTNNTITVTDLPVKRGGVVIYSFYNNSDPTAPTITWTGIDSITSDVDTAAETTRRVASGHIQTTETSAIRDLSAADGTANQGFCVVTFIA